MIGNSRDETSSPHKLLLTNRQVSNLRKSFANNSSANIKLSKAQLSKNWLPSMKYVLKRLIKSILIPSWLTTAAPAADAGINKKKLGSGKTTLIISNEKMEKIQKYWNL